MEIIVGKNAGFCYGVERAVETTKTELENEKSIMCLGELVHNSRVINDLEQKGLHTIETIEEAKGKLIIRAHGISKKIYQQAEENKIELLDLTCPNVLKIHRIIEEYVNSDYFIFLVGSKKHPETLGSYGFAGENAHIIEMKDDINLAIESFKKSNRNKILIIVQTTFSLSKFNDLVENISNSVSEMFNKKVEIEVKNTICNATKIRQEETKELSKNVNSMIIIGGKNSSNTKKLYEIAKGNCEFTYLIEDVDELNKVVDINNGKFEKVGIMAGASTPKEHIEEVVNYLNQLNCVGV